MAGQPAEKAGDLDDRGDVLAVEVADRQHREGRVRGRLLEAFGSSHLHGLRIGHGLRQEVAGEGRAQRCDQQHPCTELRCPAPRVDVLASNGRIAVCDALVGASEVPEGDACNDAGADHERGEDRVGEGGEEDRVGPQIQEAAHPVEFGSAVLDVEDGTDRVLHPSVGAEDECRGERGADRGQPDRHQVQRLRQAVPAEDPQTDESRLHEERQKGFECERCTEDVADEARVLGPVHAELELLDDASDDAEGEVDEEQLAEELGQLEVAIVARAIPDGLENRDEGSHRNGDWDK